MGITIKFVGAFRGLSGRDKLEIPHNDAIALKYIVKEITEKLPQLNHALIDSELQDPRPNTLIIVNGKEISVLNGLDTMLKNGDEVVFVPVVHGG
ncbi:MoaD/ThiS family protein [Candidatus Bathyarchaeota archaeon]|nr:MoaD/ThiS family protein [Candidatus Bathyarchaeota archaeon]